MPSTKNIDNAQMTSNEIEKEEKKDLALMNMELKNGFDFIKKYKKSVSIFGSSRFPEDNDHSKSARTLAKKIVEELGYAVLTGGGPGIMRFANQGAKEAGGDSLGLAIHLPKEQETNVYLTDIINFHYFFTRKTIMTFGAEAYVFFPGGFGTLDEFFDILTLVQTKKIPKVPIILVGADFWEPLVQFIKKQMVEVHQSIDEKEMGLFKITDDHDEIIEIIRNSPVENWWKNFQLE